MFRIIEIPNFVLFVVNVLVLLGNYKTNLPALPLLKPL